MAERFAEWVGESPLIGDEDERRETEGQLAPGVMVVGEEERGAQEAEPHAASEVMVGGEDERRESEEQSAVPGVTVEDGGDVFFDAEVSSIPFPPPFDVAVVVCP